MKLLCSGLILGLLIFTGCREKVYNSVIYPDTGVYGENILRDSAVVILGGNIPPTNAQTYSLTAVLEEDATLKIVIKANPENIDYYYYGYSTGWTILPYDERTSTGTYLAFGPVTCNAELRFAASGTATIEIYENDAETPTRTKEISWD